MTHAMLHVARAADLGEPGGMRMIGQCRCGWRTRPTLTKNLAIEDLGHHLAASSVSSDS